MIKSQALFNYYLVALQGNDKPELNAHLDRSTESLYFLARTVILTVNYLAFLKGETGYMDRSTISKTKLFSLIYSYYRRK